MWWLFSPMTRGFIYTGHFTPSGPNDAYMRQEIISLKFQSNDINIYAKNLIQQGKSEGFDSCDRPRNLKLDSNRQFFRPCDREIWWLTLKNNRALLLYYVKLCASFQIHWWIQTGFTVQKRSIRVEIGDMLSRVTLKFDGWPWKTIEHLFCATSSFVQHFVAIGEFKLELQSGNAQSGSNSMIFRAVRPWNLTNDLAKQ